MPSALAPQNSQTREIMELDGGKWLLAADRSSGELRARPDWLTVPLSQYADRLGRDAWQAVLPTSFDHIVAGLNSSNDKTPATYYAERDFWIPNAWCAAQTTSSATIRMAAASEQVILFINGEALCAHQGGYLPFECPLPLAVLCGASDSRHVRVTAVVYNNRTWTTLPPGRLVEVAGVRVCKALL